MKRILSALLVLMLAFAAPAALSGQPFARDYAAMNEAAASALILTAYDKDGNETVTCSGFIAFDDDELDEARDLTAFLNEYCGWSVIR